MSVRKRMQEAIDKEKALVAERAKKVKPPVKQPEAKPTKGQRSAAGRDMRMRSRGRLPATVHFITTWDRYHWKGTMILYEYPTPITNDSDIVNEHPCAPVPVPKKLKQFDHSGPNLFQLLEELDIMFWEWYATQPVQQELK